MCIFHLFCIPSSLNRTCSQTFESISGEHVEEDVGSNSHDVLDVELSSPTLTTNITTSKWIEEQIALSTASAINPGARNVLDEDEEEPVITLFQGFKAHHPKLAMRRSDSDSSMSSIIPPQKIQMPVLAPSVAAPSSRSSRLPAKARHQAVAINNIAKLFAELLKERENLAREAENIEAERSCAEDELKQIEEILSLFASKKKETMNRINHLVKKEDKLASSSMPNFLYQNLMHHSCIACYS